MVTALPSDWGLQSWIPARGKAFLTMKDLTLGATLTVTRTLSPHYRAVPGSCKEVVAALLLLVAVLLHP